MDTLKLIPEERFKDWIKDPVKVSVFCRECENLIEDLIFYPYGYDEENSEVYYISLCPHCGEVIYIRD